MSTLRIDNFAPSAGGTSFGIEGIAKATAHYNQTGTPAINASYNLSSVTDLAVGAFQPNFTNAFADAVYSVTGGGKYDSAASNNASPNIGIRRSAGAQATTACACGTEQTGDWEALCPIFLGDLA